MMDESDEWFDDVSWNFNDTNDITISLTYYGQVDKLIHHCEFFWYERLVKEPHYSTVH